MTVVGRHQRQRQFLGDFDQAPVDRGLFGNEVFLKFEIKPVVVEDLGHLPGSCQGLVHASGAEHYGNLPAQAGGHGDQPFIVLAQQLPVDAGTIVKTFAVTGGNQPTEIAVADEIFTEQDIMIRGLGRAPGVGLLEPAAGGDIDLAADDRFDPGGNRLGVELDGAEHVAVVGHGHRRHPVFLDPLD